MKKGKEDSVELDGLYYSVFHEFFQDPSRFEELTHNQKISKPIQDLLSFFAISTTPNDAIEWLSKTNSHFASISKSDLKKLILGLISKKLLVKVPMSAGTGTYLPKRGLPGEIRTLVWNKPIIIRSDRTAFQSFPIKEMVQIGKYCSIADGVEFFLPSVSFNHDPNSVSTCSFNEEIRKNVPEQIVPVGVVMDTIPASLFTKTTGVHPFEVVSAL